ncbi:MAG TPA: hypothetical protein VHB79_02930 [Polyangiaceae bacterium]|nr:hypothetical protein [Polyangiaceae bacterium]
MSKQPSQPSERLKGETAPDSGEQPFDPSHFGKHQFPDGLREELIRAEKPRIDPKFLQDTVPPNRKPVLTEPEQPVTTPRGGFAAPKQQGAVDRAAPPLVAAPMVKQPEVTQDAVTLVKVPTVKAPQTATNKAADSPSAPPVDTSRSDPTLVIPGVRSRSDKRGLVIGVVAGLSALIVVALLIRPGAEPEPTSAAPAAKPPENNPPAPHAQPAIAAPAAPVAADATPVAPIPSISETSSQPAPSATAPASKKTASSQPQPPTKPAPATPKTRPGFDPSKPWEED